MCVIKHLSVSNRERNRTVEALTVLCLPTIAVPVVVQSESLLKQVFFTDNSVFGVFKSIGKNSVSEEELQTVIVKF